MPDLQLTRYPDSPFPQTPTKRQPLPELDDAQLGEVRRRITQIIERKRAETTARDRAACLRDAAEEDAAYEEIQELIEHSGGQSFANRAEQRAYIQAKIEAAKAQLAAQQADAPDPEDTPFMSKL